MKFKDIYNPKHVYEGFFETYFIRPFFHHYIDFKGKESFRSACRSLLAWAVVTLGVVGAMMGQVGLIGPEAGSALAWTICGIWLALSIIPLVALFVRVLNGAPKEEPHPRMLGVDTLLGVSCLLFFVLGLLMMVTTLESGTLDPNAGATAEGDTLKIEEDYVTEEPIFTYQDAAPADQVVDSMNDVTEQDLVTSEESYDPSIEMKADEVISDSL